MRKVLLVATVGGFVSQFEMNDVRLLQDKDCEIHYASNFDNNVYHLEEKIYERNHIKKHNVSIAKSPFNISKNYKAYRDIKRIIDSEDISLVHCHTPVGGVIARMAAARSKGKPKVIYTAHGFHFYKGAPLVNWCIYYLVEKLMARFTDAIVTINEEDYQRASSFKLRPDGKVYKISGVGIDLERYKRDSVLDERKVAEKKQLVDLNNDRNNVKTTFKIVSISEINKNKNHKVVIKAINKLVKQGEKVYYDIYGKGSNEEFLQKYIDKLGVGDYVKLKGYIEKTEEVLKSADCFAFPSIREGLGMSALEAMACGLPVIARENRGTKEYMVNGHNGIVCSSDDAKEYAKAILKLKNSVETRKTMGRNARETVKKFSVAHTEVIMRQVYDKLL